MKVNGPKLNPEVQDAFYSLLKEKNKNPSFYPQLSKSIEYVMRSRAFSAAEVLKEKEELEKIVFNLLARTSDEKELLAACRAAEGLRRLFNLELSKDDFTQIQKNPSDYSFLNIAGFFNLKIMATGSPAEDVVMWDERLGVDFQKALQFYDLTFLRDKAFLENMLEQMDRHQEKKAILVCGGFHTEHLKELLQARGISYVVVVPRILKETSKEKYEKILLDQLAPGSEQETKTASNNDSTLATVPGAQQVFEGQLVTTLVAARLGTMVPRGARLAAKSMERQKEDNVYSALYIEVKDELRNIQNKKDGGIALRRLTRLQRDVKARQNLSGRILKPIELIVGHLDQRGFVASHRKSISIFFAALEPDLMARAVECLIKSVKGIAPDAEKRTSTQEHIALIMLERVFERADDSGKINIFNTLKILEQPGSDLKEEARISAREMASKFLAGEPELLVGAKSKGGGPHFNRATDKARRNLWRREHREARDEGARLAEANSSFIITVESSNGLNSSSPDRLKKLGVYALTLTDLPYSARFQALEFLWAHVVDSILKHVFFIKGIESWWKDRDLYVFYQSQMNGNLDFWKVFKNYRKRLVKTDDTLELAAGSKFNTIVTIAANARRRNSLIKRLEAVISLAAENQNIIGLFVVTGGGLAQRLFKNLLAGSEIWPVSSKSVASMARDLMNPSANNISLYAAANPNLYPTAETAERLAHKNVQGIFTQPPILWEPFEQYLEAIHEDDRTKDIKVHVGITAFASPWGIRFWMYLTGINWRKNEEAFRLVREYEAEWKKDTTEKHDNFKKFSRRKAVEQIQKFVGIILGLRACI